MSPSEPTERFPRAALPERYRHPVAIGYGGMAEVYRAEDAVLGRTVAVKVLAERLGGDEEFRRRFRREAVSAARIAHQHVATVYDVGEHEGRPYLVMEHLPGGALADRIAGRPSPAEALEWIEQIASALDAAHAKGVVHRDIKPANLLLDATGHVKVADFGIARVLEGGGSTVTAAGTVLGTTGYLAPEQARAEPATFATDVYALAAVAFELFTGERPFGGRAAAAEMAAHLYEPVPRASDRAAGLPPEVDGVLARGMAKEQEDRPPSAGALAAELRAAVLGLAAAPPVTAPPPPPPEAAEPPPTPPPPPPPRRSVSRARRRGRLVPALVVLAVLLAAGGIAAAMLTSREPEPDGAALTRAGETGTASAEAPRPSEDEDRPGTEDDDPARDPAAARVQVDRSTARLSEGDAAGALPLAIAALETLQGSGDPYEGNAGYNAGRSLIDLGRCEEAVPFLEASADTGTESQNAIRRAALDEARACAGDGGGEPPDSTAPPHLEAAIALTDQATARIAEGDPAGALALAAEALTTLQGTGHRYEGNASYDAGRSLIDLGRCDEAIPLLERSLDIGTGTKDERRIRRETLKEAQRCD